MARWYGRRRAADAGVRETNALRRRRGALLLLGSWAFLAAALVVLLQILIASSDAVQDAVLGQLYTPKTHPSPPPSLWP